MNRQILWLLFLVLIWPKPLLAQLPGNATLVLFPGTPTGNCNSRQLALDESNGSLYTCVNAAHGNQGTWQIIAGGGGGGWNPPQAPGNTIFGNNTLSTSAPSFFDPGGDVSFSAGNFSVNQLHFGPNALALTNTGIANGNCLQVSGGSIIGGACGTGTTGGLSGSGTVNLIPKFTAATALGNSLLTDNGTTLTYTGTGGIVAPKVSITQGPFQLTSVEGALPALPGANSNALVSGPDGWYVSNANSAFFKIEPPGTGGTGGAVVSVFGRTGPVLAANNDYSVSQVTGAAPLASPAFSGTPTAPAPTGAAATSPGNTQIATTAFVFAHVGAGGGVTGTGTTNYITKWTGASAIGDTLLSDNGTVLNYTGTGGITTAAPSTSENSNRVATTAWVKANFQSSGGGGGGTAVPIGRSAMSPTCWANNTATNSTLDITTGLNIVAGDTVMVSVMNAQAVASQTNTTITDNAAGGSNVYDVLAQRITNPSGNRGTLNILAVGPGTAKAATTMHVSQADTSGTAAPSKFVVCVATYLGVNAFGTPPYPGANTTTLTSLTTGAMSVPAGGVIFAAAGVAFSTTMSWSPGQEIGTAVSSTPAAIRSGICENPDTTAGPGPAGSVSCTATFAATGSAALLGVDLIPGVTGPATFAGPKVVGFHRADINVTSAVTDTPFMLCPIVDCPAGSFYRIAWDFLGITGCTAGVFQVNVDYIDEASPTDVHHTGMMSSPGATISGTNHVFGSRLMTVAAPLPMTGTPTWAPNTGIWITTSVPTACSGAAGKVQMVVSIERLQ